MSPMINLKLFANLSTHLPPNADRYVIEPGMTIETVILRLSIKPEAVKLIFVDGRSRDIDYQLQGGERVGLFPPVGGG